MKTIKLFVRCALYLLLFFGFQICVAQKGKKIALRSSQPITQVDLEDLESRYGLNATELIQNTLPKQTLGGGVGVGFNQDFKETTLCVKGEYLRKINVSDNSGWYLGGEASYETTSFNDFTSNQFVVGPKLQYNIPVIPSEEAQLVAGLMANYTFGDIDNNGFNEDFTGTIFCLYGGFNFRVCENWSVGVQIPVLINRNITYKPETGGEFKEDETNLHINKSNPASLIIRGNL